MLMGKVVGTVVSTQKDEGLKGYKLMVVQQVDLEMKLKPAYIVAADAIGCGINELVIVVQGSSARIAERTKNKPVDAAVIAIVDSVEVGKSRVYSKFEKSEKS